MLGGIQASFDLEGKDEKIDSWLDTAGHWASVYALLPGTEVEEGDTALFSAHIDISGTVPQYELWVAVVRGVVPDGVCGVGYDPSLAQCDHVVMPWTRTSIP